MHPLKVVEELCQRLRLGHILRLDYRMRMTYHLDLENCVHNLVMDYFDKCMYHHTLD